MTKYLTKSAAVLSDADRFETQISWMLFVAEQEALLAKPGIDWVPGDPLYTHPWDAGGDNSNCVRYMIELFRDADLYDIMRCKDCEVSWNYHSNDFCWVCGKEDERNKLRKKRTLERQAENVSELDVITWLRHEMARQFSESMVESFNQMANSARQGTYTFQGVIDALGQVRIVGIEHFIVDQPLVLDVETPTDCPEKFDQLFNPLDALVDESVEIPLLDLSVKRPPPRPVLRPVNAPVLNNDRPRNPQDRLATNRRRPRNI